MSLNTETKSVAQNVSILILQWQAWRKMSTKKKCLQSYRYKANIILVATWKVLQMYLPGKEAQQTSCRGRWSSKLEASLIYKFQDNQDYPEKPASQKLSHHYHQNFKNI